MKRFILTASMVTMVLIPALLFSDSGTDKGDSGREIVRLSISPATLRLYPGGSMQLIATAYDSTGRKVQVKPEWKLESENGELSLGEFDREEGAKVIFSAMNSGNGTIVAEYDDIEAEIKVMIYKKKGKR